MLGTADNCTPIPKPQFSSESSLSFYCLNDETPYIFLKSKINEYIFTDQALILIERDNAAGVKQIINRYDWQTHRLSHVIFETPGAGMTDYACEIKFRLDNREWSIDIVKAEIATARMYYAVLIKLAREQLQYSLKLKRAESVVASHMINAQINDKSIGQIALDSAELLHTLVPISYKHVFQSLQD